MEHPLGQVFQRSGPGSEHGNDSITQRAGQLTLSRTEIPQGSRAPLPPLHGHRRVSPAPPSLALKSKQVSLPSLGFYPPSTAPGSSWPVSPRHRGPITPRAHVPEIPGAAGREAVPTRLQSHACHARV